MNTPHRVLVTGSAGFLGSHICHHFARRGAEVTAVSRRPRAVPRSIEQPRIVPVLLDLPHPDLEEVIRAVEPDLVVHCAGTASVAHSVRAPYDDFSRGVDVCAATLDAVRRAHRRTKFVLLSSAAVYGSPDTLPIAESAPISPISPYGFHKRMVELLV
ncbi:MAG: NAD-dependent epimerase/dehydratase family protein, partial [Myxococcota bacterium]